MKYPPKAIKTYLINEFSMSFSISDVLENKVIGTTLVIKKI